MSDLGKLNGVSFKGIYRMENYVFKQKDADTLIGTPVTDETGKTIGKVIDASVDNGEIEYTVG